MNRINEQLYDKYYDGSLTVIGGISAELENVEISLENLGFIRVL